jgi:hypothetical protein
VKVAARDIRAALYAPCEGGVTEMRAWSADETVTRVAWHALDDHDGWAATCKQWRDRLQLFWGVATRRDDSSGKEDNLLEFPAAFIDIDFKQRDEAEARRELATFPFAPSLVLHSGGGLHVYWFLREALSDMAEARRLLLGLITQFHADPSCKDPSRIMRIPGSRNLKPDYDTPRPVAVETFAPDTRVNASALLDLLEEWGAFRPTATPRPTPAVSADGVIPNGQRNTRLYEIGRSLHNRGIQFEALREALSVINIAQCRPPLPDEDIVTLARNCDTQGNRSDFTGASASSRPTLLVRRLSEVQVEPLDPLWPAHLYRGKFHLWAGMGEIGKTYAACDLAARGSRGGLMPDGSVVGTFRTLIVTAEDGAADTIRPRIDRLGGDPSLIYAVDAETAPGLTLGHDMDAIEQAVIDTQADVLVLDTLNSFMGGKLDSKQDTAIRTVLGPLAAMAARRRLAVIGIGHFGKGEQPHVVNRILGSVGFVNAARVVAGFTADPDAPGRSFYAVIKSNLARKPDPLAYRIDPDSGRIVWESAAGIDVQAVFSAKPTAQSGKLPQAIAWLTETLTPYGSAGLASTELLDKGKAAGFSRDLLFAAKKAAGIAAGKNGLTGGWRWILDRPAEVSGEGSDGSPYTYSSYSSKDREDRRKSGSVGVSDPSSDASTLQDDTWARDHQAWQEAGR